MTLTMIDHSSSALSLHRMVKWIVLVSSTMAGVLLVSLTIAELPPLPNASTLKLTTTSTASTTGTSLRAAVTLHPSTAKIAMSGSSLSTSTTPSSTTPSFTTTTTPSWSSNSNSTVMDWSNALLGVEDDKNTKSVADESQQQLVPSQQGQGPEHGHGHGRPPAHTGKKKDEEHRVQQRSTHNDSVDVVADIVAATVADAAASVANTARPVLGEGDESSMRQYQQPYQYQHPNQQSLAAAPLLLSLTDLIDDEAMEIKRDVQFLMDFAVIGHPKCGTTFLLRKWLGQHAEIVMPARETRVLSGSTGAVQMVQALYPLQQLPVVPISVPISSATSGSDRDSSIGPPVTIKRGYKNPAHILRPWALQHFETYWPTSKLIIGVRHPVLWFESFYNYRLKRDADELPPPASLMGACTDHMNDVCTDNANFHIHLAMLGKTNLTALERVLLESTTSNSTSTSTRVPRNPKNLMHLPNPVFLYDVSQLGGSNVDVSESVRRDMQDYLGLQQPLPVLEPTARSISSSASSSSQEPSHNLLDICLPEHDALRQELLQIAWQASEWITTYFLPLSDVTVPAPEHFRSVLLNDWRNDPCETRKTALRPGPGP